MDHRHINPTAVGKRIRERRLELGLSTGEVGVPLRKRGLRGYSQQNIVTLEQGATKDPRRQVMDLAEVLYTSVEWLLYGTGTRETGARILSQDEIAKIYASMPLADRERISEEFAKHMLIKQKQRKTG